MHVATANGKEEVHFIDSVRVKSGIKYLINGCVIGCFGVVRNFNKAEKFLGRSLKALTKRILHTRINKKLRRIKANTLGLRRSYIQVEKEVLRRVH